MSDKPVKTTAKQFEEFKASFLRWQRRLGLTHYGVTFRHEPLDGCYANINTSHMGKIATATFSLTVDKDAADWINPTRSGRHEAFHLLTGRLKWLAEARFLFPEDIAEEDEAIVRRLEALFDGQENPQE